MSNESPKGFFQKYGQFTLQVVTLAIAIFIAYSDLTQRLALTQQQVESLDTRLSKDEVLISQVPAMQQSIIDTNRHLNNIDNSLVNINNYLRK